MEQRKDTTSETRSVPVDEATDVGAIPPYMYIVPLFLTVAFAFTVGYLVSFLFKPKEQKDEEKDGAKPVPASKDVASVKTKDSTLKNGAKASKKSAAATSGQNKAKDTYAHPLLVTSLKGHTGEVFDGDFSQNGKYFATCSEGKQEFVDKHTNLLRPLQYLAIGRIRVEDSTVERQIPSIFSCLLQIAASACGPRLSFSPILPRKKSSNSAAPAKCTRSEHPFRTSDQHCCCRHHRLNIEFDHATSIQFSPDSK